MRPKQYQQQVELAASESEFSREWIGDRAHLHTYQAGAFLPSVQALITGVMVGLIVTIIAVTTHRPKPFLWGLTTWFVIQIAVWSVLLWRWMNLTAPLERLTGWDLNRDGYIGETENIRIEFIRDEGRHVQFGYFDLPQEKMALLCDGLQRDVPFAEAHWVGGDKPFTRNQFAEVRKEFLKHGWAEWNNPRAHAQGMALTSPGEAVVRYLATHPLNADVYANDG